MFERFTDRARLVMAFTNEEAERLKSEYIGTEHILIGLMREDQSMGAYALKTMSIDLNKVRLGVEKVVKANSEQVANRMLPQTPRARNAIHFAIEEARNLNHNYVGTEHLLLGLIRDPDCVASYVLWELGLKLEEIRATVLKLLNKEVKPEPVTEHPISLWQSFIANLRRILRH